MSLADKETKQKSKFCTSETNVGVLKKMLSSNTNFQAIIDLSIGIQRWQVILGGHNQNLICTSH